MPIIPRTRQNVKPTRETRPFAEGIPTETEAPRKGRIEPTLDDRSWAASTSPFADVLGVEPGTVPPISGGAPIVRDWDALAAVSAFMDRYEASLT